MTGQEIAAHDDFVNVRPNVIKVLPHVPVDWLECRRGSDSHSRPLFVLQSVVEEPNAHIVGGIACRRRLSRVVHA